MLGCLLGFWPLVQTPCGGNKQHDTPPRPSLHNLWHLWLLREVQPILLAYRSRDWWVSRGVRDLADAPFICNRSTMNAFVSFTFLFVGLLSLCVSSRAVKYQPVWESLDLRPNPAWYDEAKFGIFMHWGLFAVPGFSSGPSAWFWWFWKGQKDRKCVEFMEKNYPPGFSYADFAPLFKAEFFDPNQWSDLFARSGAR